MTHRHELRGGGLLKESGLPGGGENIGTTVMHNQ